MNNAQVHYRAGELAGYLEAALAKARRVEELTRAGRLELNDEEAVEVRRAVLHVEDDLDDAREEALKAQELVFAELGKL